MWIDTYIPVSKICQPHDNQKRQHFPRWRPLSRRQQNSECVEKGFEFHSFLVKRYHSCPPFLISMSVQNGAMILWEPLIGKEFATNWLRLLSNVTSPLVFTFENQNINTVHEKYFTREVSKLNATCVCSSQVVRKHSRLCM